MPTLARRNDGGDRGSLPFGTEWPRPTQRLVLGYDAKHAIKLAAPLVPGHAAAIVTASQPIVFALAPRYVQQIGSDNVDFFRAYEREVIPAFD